MTILKAPCMSLKARGTFADILTFSGCRSSHVAKRRNRKHNRNTIAQRGHRSMLAFLAAVWIRLIAPANASWVASATAEQASAYHWFMKWNLARWKLGKGPCWWYSKEDTGTAPTLATWSLTNHRNYVRLNWPPAGYANVWLAVWHKGSAADFVTSPATAIDVQRYQDVRDSVIADKPKQLGTHYYRLQLFNLYGKGLVHADTKLITVT